MIVGNPKVNPSLLAITIALLLLMLLILLSVGLVAKRKRINPQSEPPLHSVMSA